MKPVDDRPPRASTPSPRSGARLAAISLAVLLAGPCRPAAAQSSFSRQRGGSLVLYMLLEDLGYRTGRISDVGRLTDELDVLLVLGESNPLYTKTVQRWVAGGKLVIYAPPLIENGYCADVAFGEVKVAREMKLKGHELRVVGAPSLKIGKAACQLETPKTGRALIESTSQPGRSLAFEHRIEKGRLLVLAHADLLINRKVNEDDLPVVIRRWLEEHAPPGGKVSFLEQKRAGQFLEMLKRANLMPTMIHGLIWLALLFWVLGPRFGESTPPADTRRRRFSQHARALGNLYLGASASRHALAEVYHRCVARILGSAPRPGDTAEATRQKNALARLISTRTGRDQQAVLDLLEQVEQATTQVHLPAEPREVQRHFRLSQSLADLQRGSAARSGGKNRGRAQIRS